MRTCKDFEDLILTDYIDGQLDKTLKKQVEDHLSHCSVCQAFALQVKKQVVLPFEKATVQEVPAFLWQNIKQKIQQEQVSPLGFADWIQGLWEGLSLPRLVPAICGLAMVIFVGSMFFFHQQTEQAKGKERVLYLASVLNSTGTLGHTGSKNFGTPIETYFL